MTIFLFLFRVKYLFRLVNVFGIKQTRNQVNYVRVQRLL